MERIFFALGIMVLAAAGFALVSPPTEFAAMVERMFGR